jgi:hypothetical protein
MKSMSSQWRELIIPPVAAAKFDYRDENVPAAAGVI